MRSWFMSRGDRTGPAESSVENEDCCISNATAQEYRLPGLRRCRVSIIESSMTWDRTWECGPV